METYTAFETYLQSKKINAATFAASEPLIWQDWWSLFEQVSIKNFETQKKFLLNKIRLRFPAHTETPPPNPS